MDNQRLLFGAAWLTSLVLVYFIASGETAKSPMGGAEVAGGSNPANAADASRGQDPALRDRTMRRTMDQMEEVGKKEKANIPQLVARARMQSSGNALMNLRRMMLAMVPLLQLDASEIPEAMEEVERTVKDPEQRRMFYSMLMAQWAESDGQAALAYAEEKLAHQDSLGTVARAAILTAWAERDPDGAWAWFQSQDKDRVSDPNERGLTLFRLFGGMAYQDLDSTLQRFATLDESSRRMALNGISSLAGDSGTRQRLLERAASMPSDQRRQIYESVGTYWAMREPEEMVEWMRSLPAGERKSVASAAGDQLLTSRPDLVADIVLEAAAEGDKAEVYERIATHWISRDAKTAGEWLAKQPQGPELDGARNSYAHAIVLRDSAAAMDWAKSVHAEDQRAASVEHVYRIWRMKDAPAANAALEAAGLPAEKMEQLKAAPTLHPSKELKETFGL